MSQHDDFRATLRADVNSVVVAIAVAAETREEARGIHGSKSAMLATLAVRAFLFGEHDAIAESMKPRADWGKVKGTWSNAVSLAKYLQAGNKVPLKPTAKVPHCIIGGNAVTVLTADHIEALSFPIDGDTTAPALAKRLSEIRKVRKVQAEHAETIEGERLAAYLRSPEGKEQYAGEDASSLRALLIPDAQAYARAMSLGADLLVQEAKAQEAADAKARSLAQVSDIVAFVRLADANMLAEISAAIEARLGELAAGETMESLSKAA